MFPSFPQQKHRRIMNPPLQAPGRPSWDSHVPQRSPWHSLLDSDGNRATDWCRLMDWCTIFCTCVYTDVIWCDQISDQIMFVWVYEWLESWPWWVWGSETWILRPTCAVDLGDSLDVFQMHSGPLFSLCTGFASIGANFQAVKLDWCSFSTIKLPKLP